MKLMIEERVEMNTTNLTPLEKSVLDLVRGTNEEVAKENSNKNSKLAPTQRDLIAGEMSKHIAMTALLPEWLVKAHKEGVLHYHDADYAIQPIFNCCLANIKDMLENGTVISNTLIETPKSFQTACTILTQIVAQVSSGQYGGQSVAIKHLAPYLRATYDKAYNKFKGMLGEEKARTIAEERMMEDLDSGVQTIQYQVQTLLTTNGQSPFLTIFLEIEEGWEYERENALIVEAIIRQRLQGVKNEKGVYVTPAFPKLIYVLDKHNCFEGGKYDYITKLCAECNVKRLYPDYISAKKMKEIHGHVFSSMGCRSFLSYWEDENGNPKYEGRFNQGVISINIPQIAILSEGNWSKFLGLLDERLEMCREALMVRHNLLRQATSDISPIHFQHGAIARLKQGESIVPLLENGYSTLSLGYIGIYEAVYLLTGESHTTKRGAAVAVDIMRVLKTRVEDWKKETGLGFGLYGSPAESLCYRFAKIDKERFGSIKNVTDKGYYTNSYHKLNVA